MNHKPVQSDEELLKIELVRCYHPPVNETHLADYILVPFNQVYEYTKELYNKEKQGE